MHFSYTCFGLFFLSALHAQTTSQKLSVPLTATVTENPPGIALHWQRDPAATSYAVFRKGEAENSLFSQVASLPAGDSTWTDVNVVINKPFEYRVQANGTNAVGFLLSGIALAPEHARGRVLLVVDSTFSTSLAPEIARLTDDLEGDGWAVQRIDVARTDSVATVKALIADAYHQAPNTTKFVFLLGHVPVPYSGQLNPDGHPDHVGAWPCDGYYGDFNAGWTDQTINNTSSGNPKNHNVPGDGKFDQSAFPSSLELGVGRVDLSDLPSFALSETELLRRYLHKDHAWRHKLFTVPARGLIEDNFQGYAEGFAQNGWKNFPPLVGPDSTQAVDWDNLKTKDYLWAYGCGGGWYQGMGGVATTQQYATDSTRAVFALTFGSYFGDWDNRDNLLRAALGSGTILSNAWAGRPNWILHPMGLGKTLGYCARATMSNNNTFPAGFSVRGVHIALLGDPTLRQHIAAPPQNLTSTEVDSHVQLRWSAPTDAWDGFFVYRRAPGEKAFTLLNQEPLAATSFWDSCRTAGDTYAYQVRTARLETTFSGTFWNLSQAIRQEVTVGSTLPPLGVDFTWSILLNEPLTVHFKGDTTRATRLRWDFGDGATATALDVIHTFAHPATYSVRLEAFGPCDQVAYHTESVALNGVAVRPEPSAGAWKVFPNPAHGTFRVENTGEGSGPGILRVLASDGTVVHSEHAAHFMGRSIALPDVPAGLYWVEIRTEAGVRAQKIQLY